MVFVSVNLVSQDDGINCGVKNPAQPYQKKL